MDDKSNFNKADVQSANSLPATLTQTGDKNIAVAHADNVSIFYGSNAEKKAIHETPTLHFDFSLSFAMENIILDVNSESGVNKVFRTDYINCKSDDLSTKTKNQIMTWYVNGKSQPFRVTITDKRVDFVKSHLADIKAKIAANEELNGEEEIRYNNLGLLIQRFEHERRVKEKAVTVYLNDKYFHAYCQVGFYTHLIEFTRKILDFPYRQGMTRNDEYRKMFSSFDVYMLNVQKEFKGEFVVDLLFSDVENAYKKASFLQSPGNLVCDWGSEMAKKIAIQYYVQYIGRQIVDHKRLLLETTDYTNNTNMCIQYWSIGPH